MAGGSGRVRSRGSTREAKQLDSRSVVAPVIDTPFVKLAILAAIVVAVLGCSEPKPVAPGRYQASDRLFSMLETNVAASEALEEIVDIDHSRLGAEEGSVMPPARVLIFSNPTLEAELMRIDPRTAIDLPLRVLAYESTPGGESNIVYNAFAYLRSRYGLGALPQLEATFEASMATALRGITAEEVTTFPSNTMQPDGIITLDSPFDLATTIGRLTAAIDAQDDTVWFGKIDFQARAAEQDIEIEPAQLLLFGAPAPGAKAMAKAPTLGLDGFCQKLLVWRDDEGTVKVAFNDLVALADRQGVSKSIALRIINYRLKSTFESALDPA